ncbi:ImmA/IrrE family metallo-endopeptidase [Candidatus Saccharibacteria bacterium]|nr:ImmA/IrrE family metallo-endopeptidase [Candidatus Saccharibacteria bacterium]
MENIDEIIIRPIKSPSDLAYSVEILEKLLDKNPDIDTDEYEKIVILSNMIEEYERQTVPVLDFDAVDVIKFRMEQLGLRDADLVPYLGSASRVSEILSRKRQLTTEMINDLSDGLGIDRKALLKTGDDDFNIPNPVFKQMMSRGYFDDCLKEKSLMLKDFFKRNNTKPALLYRRSKFRTNSKDNHYIAIAWAARVIERSKGVSVGSEYSNVIDLEYMRALSKLSINEDTGPLDAIKKLRSDGVIVIIEPALSGAKIDGVCILDDPKRPVIGLSLRFDRLDNFWFTLMHELAHVCLHIDCGFTHIYDNMEQNSDNVMEREADSLAEEALVDSAKWASSPARILPSPLSAKALADELGVHVAIIAGKSRFETKKWKYLANFTKGFTIRDKFKEVKW